MSGGWTADVSEVSVIMPSHRCGRLRLSLRSALAQLDVVVEVIVVDDGSSDGTAGMIESLDNPVFACAK